MDETRNLVIGAGISGLAFAWLLHRAGRDVLVLEASDRIGGCIGTHRERGVVWDFGPTSLAGRPETILAPFEGLELDSPLVRARPEARRRYLYRDGRLHALPRRAGALLLSRLLSLRAKTRIFLEPWRHRPAPDGEETFADFVRRHFDDEVLRFVAAPFLSGIFAGDPEKTSFDAAFPDVRRAERQHGSLLRAAAALRKASGPQELANFRDGMGALPRSIGQALASRIRTGHAVTRLARDGDRWIAEGERFGVRAEEVALALPAGPAARLLAEHHDELGELLRLIPYAPIAVIGTLASRDSLAGPLASFGYLVPRGQSMRHLGTLFVSSTFPERAPEGTALLTTFIGGATDPEALHLEDQELLALTRSELGRIGILDGDPLWQRVHRHPGGIPQYVLGHEERVRRARAIASGELGLRLLGSHLDGVSVPKCIETSRREAETLLARGPT